MQTIWKSSLRSRWCWLLPALLLLLSMSLSVGDTVSVQAASAVAHVPASGTTTISQCTAAALDSAISNAQSGDTLLFGCSGTIMLDKTLNITTALTLDGNGNAVTLDGGGTIQLFNVHITYPATFTLNGLTLQHGNTSQGGAIYDRGNGQVTISNSTFTSNTATDGGAIYASGGVTISNSTFTSNTATDGGAIYNYGGGVNISSSTFTSNTATDGGAIFNGGGAIYSGGTADISSSTFTNNQAPSGGAIYNYGGIVDVTISSSTFTSNGPTGAIFNSSGGLVTISSSTFTSNGGGAIINDGTVTISSSTFTSNTATDGGAIANSDGTVTISSSTFTSNTATDGGAIFNGGGTGTGTISSSTFTNNQASIGGAIFNFVGTVNISGSIVAGNKAPSGNSCYNDSGAITDQGYNLESGTSCGFTGKGSQQNVSAAQLKLAGVLADNGGFTQTIALQAGSVAIGAIPTSAVIAGTTTPICPTTDQRGYTPPAGLTTCDIGAYQSSYTDQSAPTLHLPASPLIVPATSASGATVNYTVTATDSNNPASQLSITCSPSSGSTFAKGVTTVNCSASDPAGNKTTGSFQVSVTQTRYVTDCSAESGATGRLGTVLTQASPGDTILFTCSGTIPITSTLSITQTVTIDGNGNAVILDGGNTTQLFNVNINSPATFTLNGLTLQHGTSSNGGAINNTGSGTVNISNSTFTSNQAPDYGGSGGAIFNYEGGQVNISSSTFTNNQAPEGGAIFNSGGTVNISNSTFTSNQTSNGGYVGAIFNGGTVNISGSIIAENSTSSDNDCAGPLSGSGAITDQGYNLESGTSCGFTGTGSKQNVSAAQLKLDPNGLANNGGPTETIALQTGSVAIGVIPIAQCPATDQRGYPRPAGLTTCDIGAYQSNYLSPAPTVSGPASAQATAVTLNGSDQTTTYALPLVVTNGAGAGWKLSITSTLFSDGQGHRLSATASSILNAPTVVCAPGATCTALPGNSVSYPLTVPAGASTPPAIACYDAAITTGIGVFDVTPTITVAIPANTLAGNYTSTVTVAIVSGP